MKPDRSTHPPFTRTRIALAGLLTVLVAGCASDLGTRPSEDPSSSPPVQVDAPGSSATVGHGARQVAASGRILAQTTEAALDFIDLFQKTDEKSLARLSPPYRTLFQQRRITGDKLADELGRAVRPQPKAVPTVQTPDGSEQTLEGLGRMAAEALIKNAMAEAVKAIQQQATGRAFRGSNDAAAIEDHVKQLTGPGMRQALAAETITLRGFPGMADDDARRILRMAALQVGVRMSERLLRQAEDGFADAPARFEALLKQSEDAARMLADALELLRSTAPGRRPTGDAALLASTFSRAELGRLQADLQAMSPSGFAQDFQAQQRALRLVRAKDPGAHRDFVQRRDLAVQQTRHYVHAVTGIAGFLGFSLAYANDVGKLVETGGSRALITQAPALLSFAASATPVASSVARTLDKGLLPALLQTDNGFVLTLNGKTQTVPRAADLFQQIEQAQALPTLASGLFVRAGQGWLARLRMCDAAGAGLLLDAAMPPALRVKAVQAYLGAAGATGVVDDYSFEQALAAPSRGAAEVRMHDQLLGDDQRQRASHPALGEMQRQVSQGFTAWENEMLMRLIFANREGGAAQAALYVGDALVIRPRASAKAVFVYRQYEDVCTPAAARRADGPAAAARPAGG